MKSAEEISQKKIEQLNVKISDYQKQIDTLHQEKKDINDMYQGKIQGVMKEKEDLSVSYQKMEAKLSKLEMDRD